MAQGNAEGYIYGSATAAATVTAVNAGTNLERVVTVDQTGNFVIPGLPVGTYSVTVKGRGGEIQKYDNLAVRLGAGTSVKPEATVRMQSLDVAELQTMIDSSQTGAALNLSKETVDDLPLQRDLSSVMLLSPGVIRGDGAFGSVPSFAGASVAENNYFLNGFNITDFRHGTDYTRVPFDFQQDFQVQVGGYGAQYGRSLGGVTSVTSKTGNTVRVADTAPLLTINQLKPIYVSFSVPQTNFPPLQAAMAAGPVKVRASVSGQPEATDTGEITFVEAWSDLPGLTPITDTSDPWEIGRAHV